MPSPARRPIGPRKPGLVLPPRFKKYLTSTEHERVRHNAETAIALALHKALADEYPGHRFDVEVLLYDDTKEVTVHLDYHALMLGTKARYTVHSDDPEKVLRYAGEILERANLPREGLDDDARLVDAAMKSAPAFKDK